MSTGSEIPNHGLVGARAAIHASLLRMRRFMNKPPGAAVVLPGHDRPIDFSKISACEAILDLSVQGDVTVKDVAEELTLEHSSASRLTSECERVGLVERSRSSEDSRRVLLALTDEGRNVAKTTKDMHSVVLEALMRGWPESDIDEFARLLGLFSESVATVHNTITSGSEQDLATVLKNSASSLNMVRGRGLPQAPFGKHDPAGYGDHDR